MLQPEQVLLSPRLPKSTAQNCRRTTIVPCRGVGVANVPPVAAAGLVLFPPTAAGLMYPKPPVVRPFFVVCVAKAFPLVGMFNPVRLKILLNSARIIRLTLSLMRKLRARLMLSLGRRCCR